MGYGTFLEDGNAFSFQHKNYNYGRNHFYRTPWTYQSTRYTVHHDPLWQVHGVGNGQDYQPGSFVSRPVKKIVHDILFVSPKKVKLSKKTYSVIQRLSQWPEVIACSTQLVQGNQWTDFSCPLRVHYLIHKQHSGFLWGSSAAESLCQQFCCMISCCLLARQLLHGGKAFAVVNGDDSTPLTLKCVCKRKKLCFLYSACYSSPFLNRAIIFSKVTVSERTTFILYSRTLPSHLWVPGCSHVSM